MRLKRKNLECVAVGLAGADPQRVIDRRHEYLPVADLAGAGAGGDDLNRLVGEIGRDRDFDPQFGQEIHDIFGAAIDFGMSLLAAITLDLGYRHAMDADGGERLAHLVELEGFDDGNNEFHGQAFTFLKSERRRSRPDLRLAQVWHLSVQLAQKLAGANEKQLRRPASAR